MAEIEGFMTPASSDASRREAPMFAPKPLPKAEDEVKHITGVTCEVCGKVCGSTFGLQSHMRTHKEK